MNDILDKADEALRLYAYWSDVVAHAAPGSESYIAATQMAHRYLGRRDAYADIAQLGDVEVTS